MLDTVKAEVRALLRQVIKSWRKVNSCHHHHYMLWLNSPLTAYSSSQTLTQQHKKVRNFTVFFIPSDEKDSHDLYLQCHKPHIRYKEYFAKHRPEYLGQDLSYWAKVLKTMTSYLRNRLCLHLKKKRLKTRIF